MRPNTVAFITHEALGDCLTGPAIRVLELARAIASDVRPVLVTPQPGVDRGIEQRAYRFDDSDSMTAALADVDVAVVQGFTLRKFPALCASNRPLVVDLYCPFHLENLERRRLVDPDQTHRAFAASVDREVLVEQVARGDFFLAASARQRDYWLGVLMGCGRLGAGEYQDDPTGEHLIDVVPFGVPATPPVRTAVGLKGRVPGIAPSDRLVLWGGSIADWHDPVTPIRAVASLRDRHPTLRLAMPAGIPNPDLPPMAALARARAEAARLGVLDRHVFFFDWIPYDARANALLDAEIGVSAHQPSLETRYAWRTRLLDCLWTGLPVVCTRGDGLADRADAEGFGLAVDAGDVEGFARAIGRLLDDPSLRATCRQHSLDAAAALTWPAIVGPLAGYCRAPRRSGGSATPPARRSLAMRAAHKLGWRQGA